MFTRPKYETADMIKRHELLCEIVAMVDSGSLRTALGENLGTINAASLKKAHERVETGRTRGKIVLAGF
jgi:NADPH:quinone reductase-like Zn-dependent oxidoreductase